MADAVYIGIWQNASNPGLAGAILTTGDTRGLILVSVLTVLVTFAGGYFWTLVCLAIYRYLLSRKNVDGLDLQQQVIIRNSTSAFSSAADLIKIWWAWRHSASNIGKRTALPLVGALVVWLSVFATATLISLAISSGPEDQVLVLMKESPRCGSLDFGQLDPTTLDYNMLKNATLKMSSDIRRAKQLTSDRLQTSTAPGLNKVSFPTKELPSILTPNAPCPVANTSRCLLGESGAVFLTTGPMDSFEMFGINEAPSNRITFERQAACSPIDLAGLVDTIENDGLSYFVVDLGSIANGPTYSVPKINIPYTGYRLYAEQYIQDFPWNFQPWKPSEEFERPDADVVVLFMNSKDVYYTDKVSDPFFNADGTPLEWEATTPAGTETVTAWMADDWVSVMFCTEQYIICNPRNGLCTEPAGISQIFGVLNNTHLDLNPHQRLSASRIGAAASYSGLATMGFLSGDALLASRQLSYWMSPPLPDNQWHLETQFWFNISLVAMQAAVQEYAASPNPLEYSTELFPGSMGFSYYEKGANSNYDAFIKAGKDQCGLQLMQSTEGVVNFKVLYVFLVFLTVFILCLIGWVFEPLLNVFIRWRYQWNSKWRKARIADDKLHLLRMAVENGQEGIHWDAGDDEEGLPIITGHPTLARPEHLGNSVSYRRVYESVPRGEVPPYNPQPYQSPQPYNSGYNEAQIYGIPLKQFRVKEQEVEMEFV